MLKEVTLLIVYIVTATNQQCFSENDSSQFVPHTMLESWVAGQHNFTVSLLKILFEERRGRDVAICPACIYEGLLVAYFGAAHKTEAALARFLHIPHNQSKAITWRFYQNQKVAGILDGNNPYPLTLVNKMYISKKLKLRTCMKNIFSKELETIDYLTNVKKSINYINKWVEKQTFGQIWSLVTDLSPNATMTLVNAAYFRKKWEKEFNPEKTKIVPFRVSYSESTDIEMMHTRGYFDHAHLEDIQARVLIVPYRKNRIVMAYLLPYHELNEMIGLLDGKTLEQVTDNRNFRRVYLEAFIPKIYHSTKLDLVDILKNYGMNKIFTTCANFSGFTGKKDVFLNTFVHQSVIDVDEVGTEASQSSNVASYRSIRPVTFNLDRPFAYVIYDVMLRKTLFIGTFRDPSPTIDYE